MKCAMERAAADFATLGQALFEAYKAMTEWCFEGHHFEGGRCDYLDAEKNRQAFEYLRQNKGNMPPIQES